MTATDRLRELLDERGVEYEAKDRPAASHADWEAWMHGDRHQPSGAMRRETLWSTSTDGEQNVYNAKATEMGGRLFLEAQLVTPEQAIAATLGDIDATATRQGVGTCKPHGEWERVSQTQEVRRLVCDCGEELGMEERGTLPWRYNHRASLPNYCPNCGRKVVDE